MSTTVATPQSVESVVTDALEEFGVERELISREAPLEDLDIDSLDVVELTQIVEEKFGVQLRGDEAKDAKTVGDVIDLIVERAR